MNCHSTDLKHFPRIAIKMTMMMQRIVITDTAAVEEKQYDFVPVDVSLGGTKHAPLTSVKLLTSWQEVAEICK